MVWKPVGHGVEALYLTTPLGRWVGYGVYVYRYRGLLVDTGPPKARPFSPGAEAALLTHAHEDHAGGAGQLGLPVYGSAATARLLTAQSPLRLYRRLV
jgi:glyoxylase-like metal-dependent hydrolase (beta-lactamase superfamily II)